MRQIRNVFAVFLFMCGFVANAHAGVFWMGEATQEIEGDTQFRKMQDHIDDLGFRVRVFLREGSDYIYSFSFNDQEKVIATKIQVIDTTKVIGSPKILKDIPIKQISYAKFLEVKTIIRDYLKGQIEGKSGKPADFSVTSEENYQWIDFKFGRTLIISLGVFDDKLSIITPEYTSMGRVALKKKINDDIDKLLNIKKQP